MGGRDGKCDGCGQVFKIQLQELGTPRPSPKSKSEKPKNVLSGTSQLTRDVGMHGSGKSSSGKTESSRPAKSKPTSSRRAPSKPVVSKPISHSVTEPRPVAARPVMSQRTITCGSCRGKMSVRTELGGSVVACPHCQTKLTVPLFDGQPKRKAPQRPVVVPHSPNTQPNWSSAPASDFPAMQNYQPATFNPTQPSRRSARTPTGNLFGDAWALTFETAFPNCLLVIPKSIAISIPLFPVMLLLSYTFAVLTNGMVPASREFLFVWIGYMFVLATFGCIYSAVSSAIILDGALQTVRGRSPEFFSGVEHTGGIFSLILLQILGSFIYVAAIFACLYFVGAGAIGASLILVIGAIGGIHSILRCFAPMAVVDGLDPVAAMAKSFQICRTCPMLLVFVFVFAILYTLVVMSTCGLALLFGGIATQSYAAAYHLGNKATRTARA